MHLAILLAQDESQPNVLISFLPLIIIGAVMYLLLLRPQRKRMRERAELQQAVEVGDEVITSSGIYGFITGEDGDKFWLEIDDDVQIRIARGAIERKIVGSDDDEAVDDETADVDES
jgi:preprotein translocase subunit YajC